MGLREKIAEEIAPYMDIPGWTDAMNAALPIADRILAIPEIAEALRDLRLFREDFARLVAKRERNLGHSIRVRDPD